MIKKVSCTERVVTISQKGELLSKSAIAGSEGVEFMTFYLSAPVSQGATVTALNIGSETPDTMNNIYNLRLVSQDGSVNHLQRTSGTFSGYTSWVLQNPIVISAGQTVGGLKLVAGIASSVPSNTLIIVGINNGTATLPWAGTARSHSVTILESGFAINISPLSPGPQTVAPGSTNVTATIFRLNGIGEDIELKSIVLKFDGSNVGALVGNSYAVWDGPNKVGTGVFRSSWNPYATTTLSSGVIIPKDTEKDLTIKVDLSDVGIVQSAQTGDTVAISYDGSEFGTYGVGQTSGTTIFADSKDYLNGRPITLGTTPQTDAEILSGCFFQSPEGDCAGADFNNDGIINSLDLGLFKNAVVYDLNSDGIVDLTNTDTNEDLAFIERCFLQPTLGVASSYCDPADFNKDGIVNSLDLGLFKSAIMYDLNGNSQVELP